MSARVYNHKDLSPISEQGHKTPKTGMNHKIWWQNGDIATSCAFPHRDVSWRSTWIHQDVHDVVISVDASKPYAE